MTRSDFLHVERTQTWPYLLLFPLGLLTHIIIVAVQHHVIVRVVATPLYTDYVQLMSVQPTGSNMASVLADMLPPQSNEQIRNIKANSGILADRGVQINETWGARKSYTVIGQPLMRTTLIGAALGLACTTTGVPECVRSALHLQSAGLYTASVGPLGNALAVACAENSCCLENAPEWSPDFKSSVVRHQSQFALYALTNVFSDGGRSGATCRCTSLLCHKVLRSPPRAGQQKLHVDVPTAAMLHHPRTRRPTDQKKAPQCVSVVLHLNPGATNGTHVPLLSAADMALLLQPLRPAKWGEASERLCHESNYASHAMYGGDVLVFHGDIAHYGPANPSTTDWRWVLFVMFSPEDGPEQDAEQEYFT